MSADREVGSAVVLVLIVILIVSGSLFASTFLVGLESRAAGAAGSALSARNLTQSAVSLALAELESRVSAGTPVGDEVLGPWSGGVPEVRVTRYADGSMAAACDCLYRLTDLATSGVAISEREVIVSLAYGTVSVWSRR